ncbi:hypothetical protein [Thalassobellus suaedae]|uniref:Uncharacterized protein n=1 Tax=Thalassobellus suaedae TaxID=3074124 RepID=A0ABY9XT60_9FLAO|nr:hypothetical protein RHP51_19175 [Flavobacteriaceae bacterium HL-DH14]
MNFNCVFGFKHRLFPASVFRYNKSHNVLLKLYLSHCELFLKDLSFIEASVLDNQGIPCPLATNQIKFKIKGSL